MLRSLVGLVGCRLKFDRKSTTVVQNTRVHIQSRIRVVELDRSRTKGDGTRMYCRCCTYVGTRQARQKGRHGSNWVALIDDVER